MISIYKYLAIGGVLLAAFLTATIGAYFYGEHVERGVYASAELKQATINARKVAAVNQANLALASADGRLQQQILALKQSAAHQPAQERIVYVRNPSHPHQSVAVRGPVFVTVDAVSLFNTSFGLSGLPGAPGGTDAATGALPSAVTVSDYERTTAGNAVACYSNQQTLAELQQYVRSVERQSAH